MLNSKFDLPEEALEILEDLRELAKDEGDSELCGQIADEAIERINLPKFDANIRHYVLTGKWQIVKPAKSEDEDEEKPEPEDVEFSDLLFTEEPEESQGELTEMQAHYWQKED